jgi:hypothetical protein
LIWVATALQLALVWFSHVTYKKRSRDLHEIRAMIRGDYTQIHQVLVDAHKVLSLYNDFNARHMRKKIEALACELLEKRPSE